MTLDDTLAPKADTSLSAQARAVWAKSSRAAEWLTLPQHLSDAMGVGLLLFDHWLAPSVKTRWGVYFPDGERDVRRLIAFLCGAHDVGKASPSFICQVETLAERGRRVGLPCPPLSELAGERKSQHHSVVSDFAVRPWLAGRGASGALAEQIGSILGAHHGKPASPAAVADVPNRPRGLGGGEWSRVREELLDWVDARCGLAERLPDWSAVSLPVAVQVGMTGLLIMADWIASNQTYFELGPLSHDLSPAILAAEPRWRRGWDAAALPGPWAPVPPPGEGEALYRARFEWPDDRRANPMQVHVAERARRGGVGLMVIESTMGSGKTEAALVAAELLAAQHGAQGMLIALPTQATTNAMFERVRGWVDRQPSTFGSGVPWSIVLGHGKAALNPTYAEMVEQVRAIDARCHTIDGIYDEDDDFPETDGDDAAQAIAHQWFNGRKRRLLHNFVISTIDQLLMAGTKAKHQMLNHLALAGKVVVIDEAHASDAYMSVFLDAVLPWLGEYGVPVIVLSATLTPHRRQAMVDAYCGVHLPVPNAEGAAYPLVTTVSETRQHVEAVACPQAVAPTRVEWEWLDDDGAALVEALERLMPDDGCALIVRNTVTAAQATLDLIEQRGLGPVTLTHARFLAADRLRGEEDLLAQFGLAATIENGRRPRRHIVVATQVVEQSLDVDFDLLISDLAPADLLFQRVGRLHRHDRSRPDGLDSARLLVLRDGTDDPSSPPRGERGAHHVYGDHLLLRTSAVLVERGPVLSLPDDIAPVVTRALGGENVGRPAWRETLTAAAREHAAREANQRDTAAAFALGPPRTSRRRTMTMASWLTDPHRGSDEPVAALVRDTDPTVEVIVVPVDPDGQVITPPWLGGDPIDVRTPPDRLTALTIASWSLRLPPRLTRTSEDVRDVIALLQAQRAVRLWAWRDNPLLKGELFLPMIQVEEGSDVLESRLFETRPRGGVLRYSPHRGLEVVRDE